MDTPDAIGVGKEAEGEIHLVYVDDTDAATAVAAAVHDASTPVRVTTCDSVSATLDILANEEVDCIVSEYTLSDRTGIALLGEVRERAPDLPFVLFTDDGDESVASEAISLDVTDYLAKTPIDDQTPVLLRRVLTAVSERDERAAILDRMTDAFFALNGNWEFTYLNDRGREIINQAACGPGADDAFLGKNIWHVIPEAIGTEFYEQYHRAVDEQTAVSFESYYEGLETWFEVRAYPSSTGLSVYFRDITERREREQEITDREQALREMYRVVSEKDLSFEAKVQSLLAIGKEILGTDFAALSRVEGEDYTFHIVDAPDDGPSVGDVIQLEATNCERAILDEETLVLSDIAEQAPELTDRAGFTEMGVVCYLGTPVEVENDITGTFCFYDQSIREDPFAEWEVTLVELMGNWVSYERERQRQEQELTRERNRMAEFAGLVSHDLRNPLNIAVGHLDMIAAEYDGDPEHVEKVQTSLGRMNDLIEDLLMLARSGERVVETETVAANAVVTPAWAAVGSDVGTLELVDDFDIDGDRNRLRRLFENLLRNSVEHGSTGNRTESGDSVEHAGSADPDDGVTVRVGPLPNDRGFFVADDGPGVPEGDREQVFERGYTTAADGTGLGLRIVREIVQAHGGSVTLTESDAGGTRFEIHEIPVDSH